MKPGTLLQNFSDFLSMLHVEKTDHDWLKQSIEENHTITSILSYRDQNGDVHVDHIPDQAAIVAVKITCKEDWSEDTCSTGWMRFPLPVSTYNKLMARLEDFSDQLWDSRVAP